MSLFIMFEMIFMVFWMLYEMLIVWLLWRSIVNLFWVCIWINCWRRWIVCSVKRWRNILKLLLRRRKFCSTRRCGKSMMMLLCCCWSLWDWNLEREVCLIRRRWNLVYGWWWWCLWCFVCRSFRWRSIFRERRISNRWCRVFFICKS